MKTSKMCIARKPNAASGGRSWNGAPYDLHVPSAPSRRTLEFRCRDPTVLCYCAAAKNRVFTPSSTWSSISFTVMVRYFPPCSCLSGFCVSAQNPLLRLRGHPKLTLYDVGIIFCFVLFYFIFCNNGTALTTHPLSLVSLNLSSALLWRREVYPILRATKNYIDLWKSVWGFGVLHTKLFLSLTWMKCLFFFF